MQPLPYYFSRLFSKAMPCQTQRLREILYPKSPLSGPEPAYPGDEAVVAEMLGFLEQEQFLEPESAAFMTIALMPAYGSENYGLYDGNMPPVVRVLTWLQERFPGHPRLGFRLADAMLMAGDPAESWYPVLRRAMLADTDRRNYPTTEMFEALSGAPLQFEFDMLLLERYYQPCSEADFEDHRADFLAAYVDDRQQEMIRNLRWKGADGRKG